MTNNACAPFNCCKIYRNRVSTFCPCPMFWSTLRRGGHFVLVGHGLDTQEKTGNRKKDKINPRTHAAIGPCRKLLPPILGRNFCEQRHAWIRNGKIPLWTQLLLQFHFITLFGQRSQGFLSLLATMTFPKELNVRNTIGNCYILSGALRLIVEVMRFWRITWQSVSTHKAVLLGGKRVQIHCSSRSRAKRYFLPAEI